jgi:Hsp20/alpha crystallin family
LEVGIEPRRLTIAGKRSLRDRLANHRVIYHDACSDQIFRILGLPMEVDPSSVKTVLRDGVLELAVTKVVFSPVPSFRDKTNWIARAADYKAWRELLPNWSSSGICSTNLKAKQLE